MHIAVEFTLDLLIEKGLVETAENSDGEKVYRLTEAGKAFAAARRAKK